MRQRGRGFGGFGPSRRGVLFAGAAGGLAVAPPEAPALDDGWHQAVLERYFEHGDKASGGPGDTAVGAWLDSELTAAGYRCERQGFQAPFFDADEASLVIEGAKAVVIPQAVVRPTGPDGLTAPLRLALGAGRLDGAIALIVLPSRRWSSALDPLVEAELADVWRRGAVAAVMITTGPTGDALALNAPAHRDPSAGPVAILAPNDAGPFLDAAADGVMGRLTLSGRSGERAAFNLIARLDRGEGRSLVMSTPRSGWFGCAAERGSGLAVWLAAAHWLAARRDDIDVELVAISGHEYENLGGAAYLERQAPDPDRTLSWVHVGAHLAARDWHEYGPRLRPLPSPDPQRYLLASPQIVDLFRQAFAGHPGLEAVYPATVENSAGELTNILKAGYPSAAGFFGVHRFHHSRGDDMRCVSGALVRPVSDALRAALSGMLERGARS
ncbi:MAG: hypothetical protein KF910_09015 [Brevundimonas sp.]|uniref:hypothetical protein n=1 Tax=Brevundimonas sp. TaxID=1871086 RepID=UPI0025C6B7BC|nr:hypothetical protein [Brevundimonas sp.]MBX3477736.1 hypothetical protein [Brevundimonas sp.]